MTDSPTITPDIIAAHGLKLDEYDRILALIGREPSLTELGIDPIHLGIIMVVNMEIGLITPPVGLNLFVTSGITGMPILRVVRAAAPWLGLLLLFLVFVTYVPIVSIGLPNLLYGPLTP